jgi:hypothetical protein
MNRIGNALRTSTASADTRIVESLPGRCPAEDWRAYYWDVAEDGMLREGRAILRLPRGVAEHAPEIDIGESGVVKHVRRWGVALRGDILEALGFDPAPFLTHDRTRFAGDDAEALHVILQATHFDLPGHFIIASEEHPFLLFDPRGTLKGSYAHWYTHAGALAFLVSRGAVQSSFARTWTEDRALYRQVVRYLEEAMRRAASDE